MGRLLISTFDWLWREILGPFLSYTWGAIVTSFEQMIVLFGPVLALALLMNFIADFVERRATSLIGLSRYLWFFGWLGTSMHELGHLAFCIVFRHKVNEVKLFDLDADSGTLGYVSHSFDPNNFIQKIGNFFIGIGPLIFGSVLIYLITGYLLGLDISLSTPNLHIHPEREGVWASFWVAIKSVSIGVMEFSKSLLAWQNLYNWKIYVFLYLVFCIGSSMKLSIADMGGAVEGLVTAFGFLFVINFVTMWILRDDLTYFFKYLTKYYTVFYAVMIYGIVMNSLAAVPITLISLVTKTRRSF
jgi:hypothetical protein